MFSHFIKLHSIRTHLDLGLKKTLYEGKYKSVLNALCKYLIMVVVIRVNCQYL